jgi:hypothetical protein
MSHAIGRAPIAIAVEFELLAPEDAVEQLDVIAGKYWIDGLRIFNLWRFGLTPRARALAAIARDWLALGGTHGAQHALALADAAFAAYLDLNNSLPGRIVSDDRHEVARHCLLRPKASVSHEQHVVVHLLGIPLMAIAFRS